MWEKIKNAFSKKEPKEIKLFFSRRGFNEFARHCFAIRNTASHGDTVAVFETGKGEKVILKIDNNADTRINK